MNLAWPLPTDARLQPCHAQVRLQAEHPHLWFDVRSDTRSSSHSTPCPAHLAHRLHGMRWVSGFERHCLLEGELSKKKRRRYY